MHCKTNLFSVQISELAKGSVLMRERSRVEETIHAMQRAGAGSLQVSELCSISSEYILSQIQEMTPKHNKVFVDVKRWIVTLKASSYSCLDSLPQLEPMLMFS